MLNCPRLVAVIDDEVEMRTALARLLRGHGFRVALFASGADFFSSAEINQLDCVVLDLNMPGMSGFEILRELKSREPRLPVAILTAHDQPGNRSRACAGGASDYLLKPVDQSALFAAIERHPQRRSASEGY